MIGRRTLIGVTGATLLGSAMPLWRRAEAAAARYDIVVVGGGTAGMMLAIFAAQRHARVLVIEKAPAVGGTLPLAAGQLQAAGTAFQKEKGISDTPDMQYADIMRISHNTANPALMRLFVDHATMVLDWLKAGGLTLGADQPTAETGHAPLSAARYHGSLGNGKAIFKILSPIFDALVASGRIAVQLDTGAVDLLQDKSGKVLGVVTERADGVRGEVVGRNIVLTCGGCAANPRMFYDLHKVPLYAKYANAFSQGMGLTLGEAAGGFLWGQGKYLPQFGAILSSAVAPSPVVGVLALDPKSRPPWEIYVNAEGNRFVKEDTADNSPREAALRDQTGHRFWVVFDHNAMENAPPLMPGWPAEKYTAAFNTHPMFASGASLDEVAVKAGIDPTNLATTVSTYNTALSNGAADPFARTSRPAQIAKGPFYAIREQGWTPISTVGLAVDGNLRVITRSGAPIPNLYAAGEVIGAGATMGDAFVGGNMLTPALTFGRLLGERMLKI